MQERRCSGRWEINSPASLKIPGHAHPFYCTIDDINFKGVGIRFSRYIEMDKLQTMDIALGNEISLKVEAAVAWNKTMGADNLYGFFFTRIKDSDKENIYKFIQRNFAEKIRQQFYRDTL